MPLKHPTTTLILLLAGWAVASTHARQECLVSQNIKLPWLWPRGEVQAWVDPTMFSPGSTVLQFNITFWGKVIDQYHVVQVMTNSTTMTETQETSPKYDIHQESKFSVGWVNISLDISKNVTIRRRGTGEGEGELLISYPLQHPVLNVAFTGSNITLNCSSGQLIWRVGGKGKTHFIPLPPTQSSVHLSIYPHQPVLPTLRLTGGRTITLGLVNGRPTTAITTSTDHTTTTAQPLPPFTQHDLTIDCTDEEEEEEGVLCKIMMSLQVMETATLPSRPLVLEVAALRGRGHPFLLIQDSSQPTPSNPPSSSADTVTPPGPLSPTPTTTTTTTTTTLTMSPNPAVKGWSGWWVFVTSLMSILLIFVIIMCVVSHYHRPVIEKFLFPGFLMDGDEDEVSEMEPPDRRPLLGRSISLINTGNTKATALLRLWNAVASGAESEVEQVLETLSPDPTISVTGRDTSPYEEAHRRGHVKVLHILEAFMHRRPDVPHNDMILGVMQAHNKKVETVFAAAQGGQYRHIGGVDVLLRAHSLPGTLQDARGCSLLHYAASMALADSGPLWLADDIRSLVETHGVYVNAVDFEGQTALHILAKKASVSEQHTCWDGRTLSVYKAWSALADLLLAVGTNPSLPDHSSRHPSHLARDADNDHLADLLEKAERGESPAASGCPLLKCQQLVESAGRGDVAAMTGILTAGAGLVLPLGSHRDPLLMAVQNGHRDAVFLLLAAGAPLCAHGLLGNTPFEAAHTTLGLPALFPALIRKAFFDQLEAEAEVLGNEDMVEVVLREGLGYLRAIAELSGHRLGEELGTWLDSHPPSASTSYMDILALAASHGLTLTCQLLAVAGVHLNPLPHQPHPLAHALDSKHHHTAYALCRDLKMNPNTLPTLSTTLPPQLLNHLVLKELKKFDSKLTKKEVESNAAQDLLECARGQRTSRNNKQRAAFLYLLAELDLVTLLHQAREAQDDLDINSVVHEPSGATMLHVAAAYGKMGMVEYLLGSGADHTCHTHAGLAPVHLAAIKGHQECVKYMVEYTGTELGCIVGLTPSLMLQHFSDNVQSRHFDLLTHRQKATVSAAKGHHERASLILAGRCGKLGITSSTALWDTLVDEEKKIDTLITPEFESLIQKDVQLLCDQISHVDYHFKGKLVSCSPLKEKLELLLPETFDFCLELEAYTGLPSGCISITNKAEDDQLGGEIAEVSSTKDQELFSGTSFKTSFSKAVHEALSTTRFKFLALIPPFLGHTLTGVCIHGVYRSKHRVSLARVSLSPVIKVPRPQWLNAKLPRQFVSKSESIEMHEHLANMPEGRWVYRFNPALRCVLGRANETEHRVAQACLYLRKMLEKCWWLPKEEKRKEGRAWEIYPVGVAFPDTLTLLTQFLTEVLEGQLERGSRWGQGQFLEKVVVVLRKSMSSPSSNQTPEHSLLSTQQAANMNDALEATVQFLLDLQHHTTENGKTNTV